MSLSSLPLTPNNCHYLGYILRTSLPPIADDAPEIEAMRDAFACDSVLALRPATEEEATLAVVYVANQMQAMDAFRLIAAAGDNVRQVMQCRAQAAALFRRADAALRALERKQASRPQQPAALAPPVPVRVEPPEVASPVAPAAAPATVSPPAVAPPAVESTAVESTAVSPAAVATSVAAAQAVKPLPAEQPEMTPQQALAAAERFAKDYPRRATLLRRFGRISEDSNFTAPSAVVVRALVTGMTPTLRKLDRRVA